MNPYSLENEIDVLRALINKRLKDINDHSNPNLDKAIPVIVEAIRTVEGLVNTHANTSNFRKSADKVSKEAVRKSVLETLQKDLCPLEASNIYGKIAKQLEL